jgi:methyl-accepting chemotaxis protein
MKLHIRQKLLLGFALLLTALMAVGGYAVVQLNDLEQTIKRTQGKEALLGRANSALWALRYSLPQYLALDNPAARKKIVDEQPGLWKVVEDNLKIYGDSQGLSTEEQMRHKALTGGFPAYKQRRTEWFNLVSNNRFEEAAEWRKKYTTPTGTATIKAFGELLDITVKNDALKRENQFQALALAKQVMGAMVGGALLLGMLATFLVTRSLTLPIEQLMGVLARLRAGDYTARASLNSGDELGRLGAALDRLLDERLEGLSKQAKESEQISNSVVEIMQAMGQVAVTKDLSIQVPVTEDVTGAIGDAMNMLTSETAKVLGNVSHVSRNVSRATMEVKLNADTAMASASQGQQEVESAARELSQTALTLTEMAHMASKANESAEAAVRTTSQALATVDKTVVGINESRDLIRETEKRIKRLGERSQEITQVVSLINSIAERTGILALNASMQATAAGDAGRGFAIVADEVKRMSENAREATREISTLVMSIQSETTETVLAMNNAITRVVDVSRLADQAGTEMKGTQLATEALAGSVRSIATASMEQARSGQTLQARALTIQQASRDTTRQLTQQNEVTTKLVGYAQALVREVGVFKLPQRMAPIKPVVAEA